MDFSNQDTSTSTSGVMPSQPVSIPVTQTGPLNVPASVNTAVEEDVYTMPEKFLRPTTGSAAPEGKPKKRFPLWVVIVVIVIAVLAIAGGVAYYFLAGAVQPTNTAVNNAKVVTPPNVNVNNTNNTNNNVNNANQNVTNQNLNSNVNGNTNTNANSNSGLLNTNALVNQNTNANSNNSNTANSNSNANVVNTNINLNSTTPPPLATDTDKDTLSNAEEKLYGTKADLPDTDNDGFADGAEVLAGYDPANAAGSAKLASNTAIVTNYAASNYGYSILYPTQWLAQVLSADTPNQTIFTPKSLDTAGEFLEVDTEPNPHGFTALDWYIDQTHVAADQIKTVTSWSGLQGALSTDGYTAYFTDQNHVYAITYHFGNSPALDFPTTFTMMAKSFKIITPATTNNNTNTNVN